MLKFLPHLPAPTLLLSLGILLVGCGQTPAPQATAEPEAAEATPENTSEQVQSELKSGSMLSIMRDVADVQLKAGSYIEQLQQTQTDLQDAVNLKDHQKLEQAASNLQAQLTGFNTALNSLDLKSQEIDEIRRNIIAANEKVLASEFLNGKLDFAQIDFKQIEAQMGNVQGEMLKLAAMLVPQDKAES